MLDSLKRVADLPALLAEARQEREKTVGVLADLERNKAHAVEVDRSLASTRDEARELSTHVQGLTGRVEGLLARIADLESVDGRVRRLTDTLAEAERTAHQLLGPEGQLTQYRALAQQVADQELQTRSSLDALKRDQRVFELSRDQLRHTIHDIKETTDRFAGLKMELEQLSTLGSQLTHDYVALRDTSQEARNLAATTMETAKDIENRLASFEALDNLSRTTKERLSALNLLAEHVTQKTRTLEAQEQTIEHAIVESNRLNEMVWNMDAQVAKIGEGLRQAARVEETTARLDALARETTALVNSATTAKDAFQQDLSRMDRQRIELAELLRAYDERLVLDRKELDSCEQRIRTTQGCVADVERSVDNIVAKERTLADLARQLTSMDAIATSLAGRVDEVQQRQHEVDELRERLDGVADLSTKTQAQFEHLRQLRQTLETLRDEITSFYKERQAVDQLVHRLGTDRASLETFVGRLDGFRLLIPELESKMDTISSGLALIDEGVHRASNLVALTDQLDRQMTRVANNHKFVEKVEQRVNALYELAADVDIKLTAQLGRRAEVETLQGICDNVGVHVSDVQQKLEAVTAVQSDLLPIRADISAVKALVDKALARIKEIQKEESVLIDQERRLTDLLRASRDASDGVAAGLREAQGFAEELRRSAQTKDELVEELHRVQTRQRDISAVAMASDDQLRRLEEVLQQLEHRRSQLTFMQRTVVGAQEKVETLTELSVDLDRRIDAIEGRIAVVDAVRSEVNAVHDVSTRCRIDLEQLTEQREALATMKEHVNQLLAAAAQTNDQINHVESRKAQVDDVLDKATSVVNLLEDVHANLELLSEQKAVVDHVARDLAGLSVLVTDGQRTLKSLKSERELAERIEVSIKMLRAKGRTDSEHTERKRA